MYAGFGVKEAEGGDSAFSEIMNMWSLLSNSSTRSILGASIHILAVAALLQATAARAQLIDPNNNCVFRPGSTTCQPLSAPPMPPVSGPPYQQFLQLISASGLDINQHPTYSERYFTDRSRVYCSLLSRGELMAIVREVQFPPVINMLETPKDRPRLEVAILRIGTLNYCQGSWTQEQQIEGTIMR
jgi:hypothetical protein